MKTHRQWRDERQKWLDEQAKAWETKNPAPKIPEKLGGYDVEILPGKLKVGCVVVDEKTLGELYKAVKACKDNRWKVVFLGRGCVEYHTNLTKYGSDFGASTQPVYGFNSKKEAEDWLKNEAKTKDYENLVFEVMPFYCEEVNNTVIVKNKKLVCQK